MDPISADIALLAVRLENGKVHLVDFKELRYYTTEDNIKKNPSEGLHWKFHIWEDHIHVQGSDNMYYLKEEPLEISEYNEGLRDNFKRNIEPSVQENKSVNIFVWVVIAVILFFIYEVIAK